MTISFGYDAGPALCWRLHEAEPAQRQRLAHTEEEELDCAAGAWGTCGVADTGTDACGAAGLPSGRDGAKDDETTLVSDGGAAAAPAPDVVVVEEVERGCEMPVDCALGVTEGW